MRRGPALADLPEELHVRVLGFLPVTNRMRCAQVCKRWASLVQDPSLDVPAVHGVGRLIYARTFSDQTIRSPKSKAACEELKPALLTLLQFEQWEQKMVPFLSPPFLHPLLPSRSSRRA